ncbi:hypothetical protein sce5423 [Sorangium cellulosum So ce56]|uniref:Uncharacterized protein n=1 Tax=Sorangium cellulosum (strain So ce56) TaxID=448385 RepID=A9FY60_SORC5|nr:hypothetical protein sce5423 [Sorangium cellulosum So ce56]
MGSTRRAVMSARAATTSPHVAPPTSRTRASSPLPSVIRPRLLPALDVMRTRTSSAASSAAAARARSVRAVTSRRNAPAPGQPSCASYAMRRRWTSAQASPPVRAPASTTTAASQRGWSTALSNARTAREGTPSHRPRRHCDHRRALLGLAPPHRAPERPRRGGARGRPLTAVSGGATAALRRGR